MLFILFLTITSVVFGGQIRSTDINITPSNINTQSLFTFIFTLETSISNSDYLRVIFPFALNSVSGGAWDTYSSCSAANPTKKATVAVSAVPTDASNTYYVSFFTDLPGTARSPLTANITYFVTFTGVISSSATTGVQLPVQLFTVSNNAGKSIIYDSNTVFGNVKLVNAFSTSMVVTISNTASNRNTLGAQYNISIDFTPTVTIDNQARIDIETTSSDFLLLSCRNVAVGSSPALSSTYTTLSSNKIRVTVAQTLTAGNGIKYRYVCTVQNPSFSSTKGVTVTNWLGWADTITESGTQASGLQAAASAQTAVTWSETNHQILLGWGYVASSPTALDIFAIYRDATASEKWYQSLMSVFRPSSSLTTSSILQVTIFTLPDAAFTVIKSTIHHNLPNYSPSLTVTCTPYTGNITCTNVGQLQATSYFVSFRFNLANTATSTTASTIGQVLVSTQSSSPSIIISQSQTTITNQAIKINPSLFTSSGAEGRLVYSTIISGPTTTPYVANGANIQLNFKFNYFTNTIITLTTSGTVDQGIEFYTSYALTPLGTTPTCSIATLSTDTTLTDCTITQTSSSHTRLRFRIGAFSSLTNANALFTSAANTGTITFSPVLFSSSQFSSLSMMSENTYDYYVRWVQNFTAVSPTVVTHPSSSPFFMNSLVYSYNGLSKVTVGASFFTTGTSSTDGINDGTVYPTLIRVSGYLLSSEQTSANRLLVFFNDLEPLSASNPCFGPTGITCKYVAGSIENTNTDSLTDYSGSRRIEINTDLTQYFNIYIPVSTVASKLSLGFFVTTASTINTTTTNLGIFATKFSARINAYTSTASFSGTTQSITAAGTPPKMTIPGSTLVGSLVASTSITGVGTPSTFTVSPVNTATNIGGAYGYCSSYDFAANSGFVMQPFYTTSANNAEKCVKVSYTVSSANRFCYICPVHSTMSTTISVSNIIMPSSSGADYYDFAVLFSKNTGELSGVAYDRQSAVLTPYSISDHNITFDPIQITKSSKNMVATLSFTPLNIIPSTARINILPNGGTSSLRFTPVTAVSCTSNTMTLTSCAVSGSDTNLQLDLVSSSFLQNQTHSISFMVDSTSPSLSADETENYKITIKVTAISSFSAIHHDSAAKTYIVQNLAAQPFVISNLAYFFGNRGALSRISFGFSIPSDMAIYSSQFIKFDLGSIASANPSSSPICYVLNFDNFTRSNDFDSCDITSLSAVKLKPKTKVNGTFVIVFDYLYAPSTTTTGITGSIIAVDGTTALATSAVLPLPTGTAATVLANANLVYTRKYSDPGNVAEFGFSLKPAAANMYTWSNVYAYFPSYYAGDLGYGVFYCTVGGTPISCFLAAPRLLRFTSFPSNTTIGSTVQITVYGILTPVVPTPAGKIFIAIDNDEDPFTVNEQIEITDYSSNSVVPSAIDITSFTVSNTYVKQTSDYLFAFKTGSYPITYGKVLVIDFPDAFGPALYGLNGPQLQLSVVGSSVVTPIQSNAMGSRFKYLLPTTLQPQTSYQFLLKNVRNTDYTNCAMDRITLSIMSSDESEANYRTACNNWNTPRTNYIQDITLKSLSFTDDSGSSITTIIIPIGIYSPIIKITPPTGEKFINDIVFSISQSNMALLPLVLKADAGDYSLSFRIGASSKSSPGVYLITFNKVESTNKAYYSALPKLQVILVNYNRVLPTSAVRIMPGGQSLPYSWDLAALDLIPYSSLYVTATISDPLNSPLSIIGSSTLAFTSLSTFNFFTFSLANTATNSNPPNFTITVSGTDSKNYSPQNSSIVVTVDTAISTAPTISTLTNVGADANTQTFTIDTDQLTSIYWHVAYSGQLATTDCLRVRTAALGSTAYDSLSYNQAQYGSQYQYNPGTSIVFPISNLLSGTAYSYIFCAFNQIDLNVNSQGTFTTIDNGNTVSQITITFSRAISRNQVSPLTCLLMTQLQLPNLNVVAMDGTTCQKPSVLSSFSSYDYTNIDIYISSNKRSNRTQTIPATLSTYVNSVTFSQPSTFLTAFQETLSTASLTSLFQTIALYTGPTYTTNSIDSSSPAALYATDVTITLSGVKPVNPGFIFAVAEASSVINTPTYYQIHDKQNYKGVTIPGSNIQYSSGSAPNVTITGLIPSTKYVVYYYVSNTDQSQYTLATSVSVLQVTTNPTLGAMGLSTTFLLLVVSYLVVLIF